MSDTARRIREALGDRGTMATREALAAPASPPEKGDEACEEINALRRVANDLDLPLDRRDRVQLRRAEVRLERMAVAPASPDGREAREFTVHAPHGTVDGIYTKGAVVRGPRLRAGETVRLVEINDEPAERGRDG